MKKKLIITIIAVLVCIAAAAGVYFYITSNTLTVTGENINVSVFGSGRNKIRITIFGDFPEYSDFDISIPQVFESFTDTGSSLVSNYTDILTLTEKSADSNKRVYTAESLQNASGLIEFSFEKDGIRQSRVYVNVNIDDKLCFGDIKISIDEEPSAEEAVICETYRAVISGYEGETDILIDTEGLQLYIWDYDSSIVSYINIENYYGENEAQSLITIKPSAEGGSNIVLVACSDDDGTCRKIYLDTESVKYTDDASGNQYFRIYLLDSWSEDFNPLEENISLSYDSADVQQE